MTAFNNCWRFLAIAATAVALMSCSTHPLPDDVSRYSTEDIVRNVRCEAKAAVRDRIHHALIEVGLGNMNPEEVMAPRNFEIVKRRNRNLAATFVAYNASTIAYRFDFMITENNDNTGSLTFAVPLTRGEFSLNLGGTLNKERYGDRLFTTAESFGELANLKCEGWSQPRRNLAYPLTGSIGMRRIMNTFIDLSELRGGDKIFTDEIKFTTTVRGKINPVLELTPVKSGFQLAKADGTFERKRVDIHSVKVSLAFPNLKEVEAFGPLSARSVELFAVETKETALVNMCIAEGESREDRFNMLREISPRDYCRRNGAFAPW